MRPLAFTVLSGSNTLPGYDAAYVANDHMGVVWKAQNAGAAVQRVTIDMGADVAIDTIALIGLTGAQASWVLKVEVATQAQGAFTGTTYYHPDVDLLAGSAMPSSGRGRAYWEKPAGGPAAARYWRLHIVTPANDTAVTIARIVMGQRFQPERNFDFGAAFGVRDLGKVDWSTRGVLLRRRSTKLRTCGVSFNALYKNEVEDTVQRLLERVGLTGPILLVTDPAPDAQRQNRIYFGPLVGEIGTVWAKASAGFQWQANIVDLEQISGEA